MTESKRYAMDDLVRETGINERTIRYYITLGLLQAAHGRGPSASYDAGHLNRLQMIDRLKQQRVPLKDIKARLGDLTDRDVATKLAVQSRPPEDRWRRVQLHPDVELLVRERAGQEPDPAFERGVASLVHFAGTCLPPADDQT